MAKLALVNREQKRRAAVKKYAAKRSDLIAAVQNLKLSEEERYEAREAQQLPRNAARSAANRCADRTAAGYSASSAWTQQAAPTSLRVARSGVIMASWWQEVMHEHE
jgi:small subunit ribosomal protein S14